MKTPLTALTCITAILFLLSFTLPKRHLTTSTIDILTQGIWTNMESWKDEDGDGIFVYKTDSCEADNNWHFMPDSTIELTEDVLKCEPDMPFLDTISCQWFLKSNETVLCFRTDESDLDFQIFAIGEHELILFVTDTEYPNTPSWEKIILRR